MKEVVSMSLENDMDLVLAHKKSMQVADKLGLTIATQTTFATAVSEISRTVIEYTDNGALSIGLDQNKTRYALVAMVTFESDVAFNDAHEGFFYAQKLVPEFEVTVNSGVTAIQMKIGLPRSLKIDPVKINKLREFFNGQAPISAYEEIKRRNFSLSKIAEEKDEEIKRSKLIDEKKTEFISIASHELKTPMTVLKAYTQIAKATKEPLSEHLKGVLTKIDVQASKLNSLVQQLLDLSKIENGSLQYNMTNISLNGFVTDQLAVMQQILPNHTLESVLGKDVYVAADILRMEQVFSNLLGNAAKYSQVNTKIEVGTAIDADGHVIVSIKDYGKGMSLKTMQLIFDKFYRAQDVISTHPGLGMGLYISSKIINDHGGKIWVESEESQWTKFHFSLPVVNGA
ncbi:HAMP domain-containing histidine kinase [Mucilaginibacter sp. 14171R-50]|uniref:sensor histidine kinase n=1 Tax=Mucilaginibacter sp. 14171R-50 TaxID=2703789 RepID=UPI00138D2178|nr:HAMP domain-containing sensor histidine kinase [Mucilaginibacter sp. 14171R-50]QHS54040.1 HAMP domain-containing histidine kinase [Mucilaginibacter sp. 14171R-50]